MLNLKDKNWIDAKQIYSLVMVKSNFRMWIKRCIEQADFIEGTDFRTNLCESTGGRREKAYEFTVDAAKEMCIISATAKAKELRRWLIDLSKQKENLELITIEQAAFAVKVINCLKYVDNQREAYSIHQKNYLDKRVNILDKKNLYQEFNMYRNRITGWDKVSIEKAVDEFINEHSGYDRGKAHKQNSSTKLTMMDIGEAIRVAALDILYSQDTEADLANKFAEMCKKLAKEMKVTGEKENKETLYRHKENISEPKLLLFPDTIK